MKVEQIRIELRLDDDVEEGVRCQDRYEVGVVGSGVDRGSEWRNNRHRSRRPPNTESGTPPPTALPSTARSGRIPR